MGDPSRSPTFRAFISVVIVMTCWGPFSEAASAQQRPQAMRQPDPDAGAATSSSHVADDQSTFPYAPHTPDQHETFLQGWYTRLSTEHNTSLAVVLGQYVQSDLEPRPTEHPPVLCMVLLQPPQSLPSAHNPTQSPLLAYTRWFASATIIVDSDDGDAASSDDTADDVSSDSSIPAFQVLTTGPPIQGHNAAGSSRLTTHALLEPTPTTPTAEDGNREDASYCKMVVNASKVVLQARFPGSLSLDVVSYGGRSDAVPWSSRSATPEGWVGDLGKLVAVHYATLSLATPATFHLNLATPPPEPSSSSSSSSSEEAPAQSGQVEEQLSDAAGAEKAAASEAHHGAAHVESARTGDGWELRGKGVMHMEAQYGRNFPPRWLWAQGHDFAPDGVRAFVLAGGDLPHALPGPPLHQFLFSYRDLANGVSIAADPWDPPLPIVGIHEQVDACSGRLSLELDTLTHVIKVEMSAAPSSFTPVACPSEVGFIESSVESYTTTTTINIYQRSMLQRALVKATRWAKRAQHAVLGRSSDMPAGKTWQVQDARSSKDQATGATDGEQGDGKDVKLGVVRSALHKATAAVQRVGQLVIGELELVVDHTFTGAALEYGGKYRCGMSSDSSLAT